MKDTDVIIGITLGDFKEYIRNRAEEADTDEEEQEILSLLKIDNDDLYFEACLQVSEHIDEELFWDRGQDIMNDAVEVMITENKKKVSK